MKLEVNSTETILLPSGREVMLQKAEPLFQAWREGSTLRIFQQFGWEGVWVDSFRKQFRISNSEQVDLPTSKIALLNDIYVAAGSRYGCFDVFAWKNDQVLFAESKRRGKDIIRKTQLRWLEAALSICRDLGEFLIVEWDIAAD